MTDSEIVAWARGRHWFYRFPLAEGEWTREAEPGRDNIHESRRAMMLECLGNHFGERLGDSTCIDLACHQGYFTFALADHTRFVTSLDVNETSLEDAGVMAGLFNHKNIRFIHGDVQEVPTSVLEPADIVLMYGLIYHIEDPIRLLRRASGWCLDTLLIETQLTAYEVDAQIEWGSWNHFRDTLGLFALVDDQNDPEGGVGEIALVPSLKVLMNILKRLGFSKVEVLLPFGADAEQLVRRKRAVIAAYR